MQRRRRFKQQLPLQDRLSAWAKEIRDRASNLAPGPEKTALLVKVSQADTAANMCDLVDSPDLQPK